jgi:two-component sensor histidine kinase/DNA-binding LacI/PurR family transcriptional regulator
MKQQRPTIGFLIDVFYDQYQMEIWSGVQAAAQEENLNLVCFCGGAFRSPYENDARTKAYELIRHQDINGLIILSSSIGNYVKKSELTEFCFSFTDIPTLSIGTVIQGMPSIVVNSDQSMFELMAHCIREHGCKRIAFIKGTEDNEDAINRFGMYKKALAHFGIPYNDALVAPGDFVYGSGRRAVTILLDERNLEPDAIVSSNDLMAIDAIETLQTRGIHVPQQIKVFGFDNIDQGSHIKPALTTVSQPAYSLGYRAVVLMKQWLKKGNIAAITAIPTYLKIRQSCGCKIKKTAKQTINVYKDVNLCKGRTLLLRDDLFAKIKKKLTMLCSPEADKELAFHCANTIYTIFYISLKYKQPQIFIENLENLICETMQYNIKREDWHKVLREIFQFYFSCMEKPEDRQTLECLQIHVTELLRDLEKSEYKPYSINTERIAAELHRFSQKLIITFNLEKLKPKITEVIAKLGIQKMIITCTAPRDGHEQQVVPVIAYNAAGRMFAGFPVTAFPRSKLIRECLNAAAQRITYIVMPLFIENELLGFAVFEPSILKGIIYENLTIQLSSALKSAFIVEQLQNNADKLQRSLDEKEVLLQEIHHRVKNNLQIILSLMNFQPEDSDRRIPAALLDGIRSRIQTIALIHEELLETGDLSIINLKSYVASLAQRIVSSCARGLRIGMEIDVEEVFLDIQTATPCGLVINEILTNAFRHAFERTRAKTVKRNKISIKIGYLRDKNTLEMMIGDNGKGLPRHVEFSGSRTVGLQMVSMLVQNQLGGSLEIIRKNGTIYKIRFRATDINDEKNIAPPRKKDNGHSLFI